MLLTMAIIALVAAAVGLATAVVVAPCILIGWSDDKQAELHADADELLSE